MGLLDLLIRKAKLTIYAKKVIVYEKPNVAHSIRVLIPVHHLSFIKTHVIMANTFSKTQKVPYTLQWLDVNGKVTTDPVTGVVGTPADPTIVSVSKTDEADGFILGIADGSTTVVFSGTNSEGQPVTSQPVSVTVQDNTPPPVLPAASIGVTLGDPIPQ